MFVTENECLEGELGEKMRYIERDAEQSERETGRWRARQSPDEGVEMMGWQFPSTRLFFRAVKHIVRHCLKCPG